MFCLLLLTFLSSPAFPGTGEEGSFWGGYVFNNEENVYSFSGGKVIETYTVPREGENYIRFYLQPGFKTILYLIAITPDKKVRLLCPRDLEIFKDEDNYSRTAFYPEEKISPGGGDYYLIASVSRLKALEAAVESCNKENSPVHFKKLMDEIRGIIRKTGFTENTGKQQTPISGTIRNQEGSTPGEGLVKEENLKAKLRTKTQQEKVNYEGLYIRKIEIRLF